MELKNMKLTVGRLREELAGWDDDAEVYFEGLDFYRFKNRGERLLQIEFNPVVEKRDRQD